MRVLVCGSRDWTDVGKMLEVLEEVKRDNRPADCYCQEDQGAGYTFHDEHGDCNSCLNSDITLIEGEADGADTLSKRLVKGYPFNWTIEPYPADWKKHGRAAGPIRNQQMLDEGKPDLVLAFWKNKSRGTADMIRRARKAGVEVRVTEG